MSMGTTNRRTRRADGAVHGIVNGSLWPQPPRDLEIDVVWIDGEELVVLSHPVEKPAPLEGLSDAERQVAGDILAGLSNEQIAGRRGTGPRTVAKQVAAIFRKVGVGSRRQFAATMRETCGDRPSPTSDRRNSSSR